MIKVIACIVFVYLLLIALPACEKNMSSNGTGSDPTITNFNQVFDQFWNGINRNYVYWDMDTTNWNAVYDKYKPLFAALDLNSRTDKQKSTLYFRQMTYGLLDGHFQITFSDRELSGNLIFPAAQRKQGRSDYHYPYNYSGVDVAYFDPGYRSVYDSVTDPNTAPLHITLATINKNILYFNCNKFALLNSWQSVKKNEVKTVLDTLFNKIYYGSASIKGVIIDVRNNFGGNLSDLNFLAGRFIEQPLHFGYSRYKSGPGRLDFTPWIDAYVTPVTGSKAATFPIVVLTDNFTVSVAETIAMAIALLPNGTIIGETTWGATGPLAVNQLYNSGQFSIPGFMSVYTSSATFKYIDQKIYEGIGFTPDIQVPFNIVTLQAGKDLQLEKAIQQIQ